MALTNPILKKEFDSRLFHLKKLKHIMVVQILYLFEGGWGLGGEAELHIFVYFLSIEIVLYTFLRMKT